MAVQSVLEVVFKGTDKGLKGLSKNIGSSFKNLGSTIKAGAAIGAAAIVGLGAAVVAGGAKLIGLGSDAEEMMGKFNVVFSTMGGQVTTELETFAGAVGRSKFELMGMASSFGDILKPLGFTEEAAASMSVELTQLATDLGSFNDMPMDEALQRLTGTMVGSHENALAFGVVINENTLKAEMAANGWDKLTGAQFEQAKVQARINLLMKGTTDAQGDAARTSKSWANQTRALKASLTDTATEIGMGLLPVVTPLLEKFGELARDIMPKVKEVFEALQPGLEAFTNAIISLIEGDLFEFFSNITNGLTLLRDEFNIASPIFDTFIEIFGNMTTLLDDGVPLFDALKETMADLLPPEVTSNLLALKDAIVSIVEPIKQFIIENVKMQDVWIGLAIILGGIVLSALWSVAAALGAILLPITIVIAIVAALRLAWENDILGIRTAVTEWVEEHGGKTEIIESLIEVVKLAFLQMKLKIITLIANIKVAFAQLKLKWLQTKLSIVTALNELKNKWVTFRDKIIEIVTTIKEVWNSLKETFNKVKESVMRAIQPLIDKLYAIKDVLGSISLPGWMMPGSPTPWELGLVGVINQLQALSRQELPALQVAMQNSGQGMSHNQNTVTTINNTFTASRFDSFAENRMQAAFASGGI